MPIKKNLANIVTVIRLITSPFLLYFAFTWQKDNFLTILIFLFFTDILDGFLARTLHIESKLGMKLDSYADWLYLSFFIVGMIFLFNKELEKFILLEVVDILLVLIQKAIHLIRFKKLLPSHLYIEQAGGWVVFLYSIIAIKFGLTDLLFYTFSLFILVVASEQTAFALLQEEEDAKLHSIFQLLKKRRKKSHENI